MFPTKRGWGWLAALSVVAGLWAGAGMAAEPGWDQTANKLRAARLSAANAETLLIHAKERQLSPAQVAQWADDMARLDQAGVPASLAAERIVQGLAKGVPAERIDQAIKVLHGNLLWARQVVDAHAPKAEIRSKPEQLEQSLRHLEAALRAGVARAQLDQIFGKHPLTLEQLAPLARTAADLRGWGVEPEVVARALAPAAAAGLGARELDALERQFAAGVAAGQSAPTLLVQFEKGVNEFRARPPEGRDDFRREMRQEPMRDFKGPSQEMRPGPSGGTGGGGYPGGY